AASLCLSTATVPTSPFPLSLHDALPISVDEDQFQVQSGPAQCRRQAQIRPAFTIEADQHAAGRAADPAVVHGARLTIRIGELPGRIWPLLLRHVGPAWVLIGLWHDQHAGGGAQGMWLSERIVRVHLPGTMYLQPSFSRSAHDVANLELRHDLVPPYTL